MGKSEGQISASEGKTSWYECRRSEEIVCPHEGSLGRKEKAGIVPALPIRGNLKLLGEMLDHYRFGLIDP